MIITADLDNDGKRDILTANVGEKNYWYENDVNEQSTAHEIYSNAKDTFSITTADMNNDGNLDIVTAYYNEFQGKTNALRGC